MNRIEPLLDGTTPAVFSERRVLDHIVRALAPSVSVAVFSYSPAGVDLGADELNLRRPDLNLDSKPPYDAVLLTGLEFIESPLDAIISAKETATELVGFTLAVKPLYRGQINVFDPADIWRMNVPAVDGRPSRLRVHHLTDLGVLLAIATFKEPPE